MPANIERLSLHLDTHMPEYLELLRRMVEINSFTTNGQGVNRLARATALAFADLGFSSDVISSDRPDIGDHLVLSKPGDHESDGPTIAMISHLDTVFSAEEQERNNFYWRPEGDRIYGPGTVDIKGGTAMIYMVMSAMEALYPEISRRTNWLVLFNAAEETLEHEFGLAARSIIPTSALACLVFEGGRIRGDRFSIVAARKGMATYQITAEGKAAHAGSSHKRGANAITQLARTVNTVAGMTDYEREITFNVGTFEGGTVINRVPHRAVAYGEMRAHSPELLDEGIKRLLALSENTTIHSHTGDYACSVNVDIMRRWGPWPPNSASDGLLVYWKKAAEEMGAEIVREERGGLSDGNFLWDHVPTLDGLGPSGGNAHCSERSPDGKKDQEYLVLPSLAPKAILNTQAILHLLGSSL
ncbi:MAG: M20/M25/M40 family metallo-hydrolase [Chloroflexota bacterium]|nr:MAG: M20/M25/M40 family metallo-hydrolase [Chloroflexota bacterium]